MNREETLEAICNMAVTFNSQRDVSMLELLNRSKYRELKSEITEELIKGHLEKNAVLVQSWLMESENNRGSPAWYISSKDNKWIVGYYPGGEEFEFNNKNIACACYIKHYMEALSEL
jgi:hypothetical protein